ncbi:MAG TPA: hypothetical protein VMW12_12820 [Candidatus Dormibacteraeota bacterium]|nr:hypothetical protein [Candidatus Dormibacteraeota bacterium]
MTQQAALLVLAVVAVGILHTLVPDHWAPIALLARQSGWTRVQTARAAFIAGFGHTVSTLAIGIIVWLAGVAFAERFGRDVSVASSLALIGFGGWIAISSWREARGDAHHQHGLGDEHDHEHDVDIASGAARLAKPNARMALLLILGSSPMIEGIPAFFAASKFGFGLIALMSVLFAASTIVTYMVLCVYSHAALERVSFGPLEKYGEVLSGAFIAIVGVVFLIWPIA